MSDERLKTDLTRALWSAVDDLTQPVRQKLHRDDNSIEWVQLPSLWEQLVDAMESGQGGAGHGAQTSKPPTDTAALSLVVRIAEQVRDLMLALELKRTHDIPLDVRKLASAAVTTGQTQPLTKTTDVIRDWCQQIRTVCSSDPDRSWRLHGVACQACAATAVTETDRDGNDVRMPAVVVSWNDSKVRAIECRVCGSAWFRGADLDALADSVMTQTSETGKMTA